MYVTVRGEWAPCSTPLRRHSSCHGFTAWCSRSWRRWLAPPRPPIRRTSSSSSWTTWATAICAPTTRGRRSRLRTSTGLAGRGHAIHRRPRAGPALPPVALRADDRALSVPDRHQPVADPAADRGGAGHPPLAAPRTPGYATAMVGKWHLGFAENGYDEAAARRAGRSRLRRFFGIRASTDIPPYFYIRGDRAVTPPTGHIDAGASPGWSPIQGAFWRAGGIAPDLELGDVLPRLTDEAISVIAERRGAAQAAAAVPRLPAPHTPWLPSPGVHGQERRRAVRRFPDDGRP